MEAMTPKLPPLATVLDLLPDAVCVVDGDGRFLFASASFERIFGYAPAEVIGRPIFELVHPDDRAETVRQAEQVMRGEVQRHFRNRYIHKDGHSIDIQWSAQWLPGLGVRIGVAREVTELRRIELELEHRASHDPLTGLPNRHRLQHELQRAIANAADGDGGLALLYVDLDGFKAVNDRGGHEAGDRILQEVAERLQQGLRRGDLVARVGGDEFVVLLPGCNDEGAARAIVRELRARLQAPCVSAGEPVHVDASIGIACFPADGDDPESLLAHADRAMYAARRQAPRRGSAVAV
jgi:diguanylate cyclase (GGDEF)-like protein/PAS domain S-box-containing protein